MEVREKKSEVVLCSRLTENVKFLRRSRAVTKERNPKKCTKKGDARAKLFFWPIYTLCFFAVLS